MVNYINAECYKAFRRKYFYIFLVSVLGLVAAFMLLLRVEGLRQTQTSEGMVMIQQVTVSELLGILSMALSTGLYFLLIAADVVFSDQYKYNTLKNEVSYGLPRFRIYMGKLVSSAVVAVALCALLIGGYLALSCIFFPVRDEMIGESLRTFGMWLAVAFPLWMGGLGLFMFLQFTLKNTAATIAYVMIVGFLGSGFMDLLVVFMPSLEHVADIVRTISLNTPFALLGEQDPKELMGYAWALGTAWLSISTTAGFLCFRKKEIS